MTVYYNEFEPFAAEWIKKLIVLGALPYGDVDTRDIRDVTPSDLSGYTQCHFFAGIGGWAHALRNAGWPDSRPVWTGSCPCQPFSTAGRRKGNADERHLWPHWFHLISQCGPTEIFGEQVASKDGRSWFDTVSSDLEGMGYATGAADLCAAGVGSPHIRQRLWFYGVADAVSEQRQQGLQSLSTGPSERTWRNSLPHRRMGYTDDTGSQEHGQFGELHLRQSDRPDKGRQHIDAGVLSRLADASSSGIRAKSGKGTIASKGVDEKAQQRQRSGFDDFTGGADDRLADATGERRGEARPRIGSPQQRISDGSEPSSRLADADGSVGHERCSVTRRCDSRSNEETRSGPGGNSSPSGSNPTNGFWGAADWIACRDNKFRPVEPGTFPLADGVSNRVGRLRGYGNAIVPQVAQVFIEATQGW